MSIQRIDKQAFDAFFPSRRSPADDLIAELEWYRDEPGSTLGLIGFDQADNSWTCIVFRPTLRSTLDPTSSAAGGAGGQVGALQHDAGGGYRPVEHLVNLRTIDFARNMLSALMLRHANDVLAASHGDPHAGPHASGSSKRPA